MGKVNQLWQDEMERRKVAYLAAHPDADEAEAWEAQADQLYRDIILSYD